MTVHHLVNEVHQREFCPYCKTDLTGVRWESKFFMEKHYKSVSCGCGREILITVNFQGSGHDAWDGTKSWVFDSVSSDKEVSIRTLENRLQVTENTSFILKGEIKK